MVDAVLVDVLDPGHVPGVAFPVQHIARHDLVSVDPAGRRGGDTAPEPLAEVLSGAVVAKADALAAGVAVVVVKAEAVLLGPHVLGQ